METRNVPLSEAGPGAPAAARASHLPGRPITDYYDRRRGAWWHVPWFAVMGHRCRLGPGEAPRGTGWTHLERDPDVVAYQEAVNQLALAELAGVVEAIRALRSIRTRASGARWHRPCHTR